ncbi:MAG: phage portal protein [Clostridium sp.]
MDVKEISKIIQNDMSRRKGILESKKYYANENNILKTGVTSEDSSKDPLRNADNRISHNFHEILVNEKAAYMFTYPVNFDLNDDDKLNSKITEVLSEEFECISKDLCIEASNAGTAWLHYWINDSKKEFEYAIVNTEQVIPVYDSTLKRNLIEVYRYYEDFMGEKIVTVFEHWKHKELVKYTLEGGLESAKAKLLNEENITYIIEDIPFIEFANNKIKKCDLSRYKNLIDLYDKVISGFANDLEDIQQIIYILENYGGEGLGEFLGDLRRYKAIKTETGVNGDGGGVKTLQIEIPVEARKVILDILKKQIYESGQGLQQDTESFGNASGVALKFFYRKLELKSGLLETEFKKGFSKLVRAILTFLNIKEFVNIQQTYTRNMISNDLENAQIAQVSSGILPRKIIIRNHPWVDDVEETMALLEEEENQREVDPYEE